MNHRTDHRVTGTFTVKMTPQPWAAAEADMPAAPGAPALTPAVAGITSGRLLLDKHYQGDLQGHALGQMLSVMTATQGSAGYVAMEVFTGTLQGKRGSFALQHTGTMDRGARHLSVTVVPDSGTEELAGLSGRLDIRISEGQHYYDFDFALP